MNENFISGSKTQFKKKTLVLDLSVRYKISLLKSHAFKGGLLLLHASYLLQLSLRVQEQSRICHQ